MLQCLKRQKKVLLRLFVASLLLCLGFLLHIYARTSEAATLNMAPFFETQQLTALGKLIAAFGIFCWIAALFVVVHCLTRKFWEKHTLLEW